MNIASIITDSFANGYDMRAVVFFQGCSHHCAGCQNKHTWSFKLNCIMTPEQILNHIVEEELPTVKNITLSGGDPFDQEKDELNELLHLLYNEGYNIWCYTGYTYEELSYKYYSELGLIDVLVDGEYIEQLNDGKKYRGSSNQRIIDMRETIKKGKMILWEEK